MPEVTSGGEFEPSIAHSRKPLQRRGFSSFRRGWWEVLWGPFSRRLPARRSLCTILAALLLLGLPAAAAAAPPRHHRCKAHRCPRRPAHRTPLSIALKLAYELWRIKPCGGHYTVV